MSDAAPESNPSSAKYMRSTTTPDRLPNVTAKLLSRNVFVPLLLVTFLSACSLALFAAPPRYDHVVIVMEENRTPGQIIGDQVNAPYITSLAAGGVSLASMFAIVHPSQPNYLELFSGANQGVELITAGFSFAGYCEEIESAGTVDWADYDPHSATHPGIYYRRKHNSR